MNLTKDELMAMPLNRLRNIDIKTKEQEDIVQEVLANRLSQMPSSVSEINIRVPDITNAEQEKHWQKVLDEARAKASLGIAMQGLATGAEIETLEESAIVADEVVDVPIQPDEEPAPQVAIDTEAKYKPKRRSGKHQ